MAILTCRPRNRLSKERLRVFRHQRRRRLARLDASSTGIISNCPSRRGLFSTPLHRPSHVRPIVVSPSSPSPRY